MRLLLLVGFIFCLGVADSPAVPVIVMQHAHELPGDDSEEVALNRNQTGSQTRKAANSGAHQINTHQQDAPAIGYDSSSQPGYETPDFFILHRNIRI